MDSQVFDELIRSRRSKRVFQDRPVPMTMIEEMLTTASYAPSSSNTQPWRCYVVSGKARERVCNAAVAEFREKNAEMCPEYPFFPENLHEPYATRFNTFRGQWGDAFGTPREDKAQRLRDVEKQFLFYGAPVGIIFTMDRRLEHASFFCYGGFLQNVMLAAKARGLDTCPQQIWSLQSALLRRELDIPEEEMVVAGMSIGWAENTHPLNQIKLHKLTLGEFATFIDR